MESKVPHAFFTYYPATHGFLNFINGYVGLGVSAINKLQMEVADGEGTW